MVSCVQHRSNAWKQQLPLWIHLWLASVPVMDMDRAMNPQCPFPVAQSKRWGCISGHTSEFGGLGAEVLSTKGIGVSFCKVAIACFCQCTSGGGFSTPIPRAGTTTVRVASLVDAVAYPTQLLLELVDLPVDGAHLFPALCTLHTFAGSAGECTLVESTALLTQPLLELGGSPAEVAFLFTKGLLSTDASSSGHCLAPSNPEEVVHYWLYQALMDSEH